ncbi:MAG: tRNA dihydrouridine(20/20a) synthase DusA [Gammaproteobacteria bacterium]|nr:tRNA dihydrouridine(20/20a) synthase DusA [Gammaproteobacteria bacterium]MCK5263259.1 tRNA dihydrouridine(20/20a) synthase DusA [Gammaproteobacteria bacterium]
MMYSGTVSIAPMMAWTDRHARYFLRLISKRTMLYTEMVTTGALIHGDRHGFLRYHTDERPIVLQLGGSRPDDLADCSLMAEDAGYDEVNLNVGCPSDRVKKGRFGAGLMAEPELVAECIAAMRSKVDIPVTVKCRIGIDDMDDESALDEFVGIVAAAGCEHFIVHARKAWLQGLSPKENRDVPPLKYEVVYRLKQARPSLRVTINGGIKTLESMQQHLQHVDAVMLGREAYHNPYLLAQFDAQFYGSDEAPRSRQDVVHALLPYIEQELAEGTALHAMTRHLHGLFLGCRGAKAWRRFLSENDNKAGAGTEVLLHALEQVQ